LIVGLKNAEYHGVLSIKAGLFLHEFTGHVSCAHLDIASTAFLSKPIFCLAAEGAIGYGMRLLFEFLKNLGA
jgi:leucyl aminopeptidase